MSLARYVLLVAAVAHLVGCQNENEKPGPGPARSGGGNGSAAQGGGNATGLLPLEPFRGDRIAFARPAGFARKDAPEGAYRFERAQPSASAPNAFQLTYVGRIRHAQLPEDKWRLEKDFEARKLTVVDKVQNPWFYAMAVGDTGVDGPNRYVQVMHMSRWDVSYEAIASIERKIRGIIPPTLAVMVIELSGPSREALAKAEASLVLRAVGWGASVIDEIVAADVLPGGHWQYGKSTITTANFNANGDFTGSLAVGGIFDVKFEPGNRYQLVTSGSVSDRVYVAPDRYYVTGGLVMTYSRGEYRADGGVVTFTPDLCAMHVYRTEAPPAKRSDCFPEVVPMTLRFEQDADGRIRINGTSSDFTGWQYTFTVARPDAPGAWNIPKPPGIRVHGEPSAPINDAYNVCGLVENEPNNDEATATPIAAGESKAGCLATAGDYDILAVETPTPGAAAGWAELAVTDVAGQEVAVEVRELEADGATSHYVTDATAEMPGQSLFLYWRLRPPHRPKHLFVVKPAHFDATPFTYKADVVFHSSDDKNEPNESVPTPLDLGASKSGYLLDVTDDYSYHDTDKFKVQLAPGMVRILVEDLPANLDVSFSIDGATGYQSPDVEGTTIDLTYPVAQAGDADIRLYALDKTSGVAPARGQVPENYRKAYRITVTQP